MGMNMPKTILPPTTSQDLTATPMPVDEPDTNSISIELVDGDFYLVNQQEDTIYLGESEYIDDILDELKVHLEAMKEMIVKGGTT